jgi:hypothetical protein
VPVGDTYDAIEAFLEKTRVRWESREEFTKRHAGEWPIVRRGDAVAELRNGQWVIWEGDNPIAVGDSNLEAWRSTE